MIFEVWTGGVRAGLVVLSEDGCGGRMFLSRPVPDGELELVRVGGLVSTPPTYLRSPGEAMPINPPNATTRPQIL